MTDKLICNNGCKKEFSSISNRTRHELNYCKITKENNQKKIDETEKLKLQLEKTLYEQNKLKDDYAKIESELTKKELELTHTKFELSQTKFDLKVSCIEHINALKSSSSFSEKIAETSIESNMKLIQTNSEVNIKSMSAMTILTKYVANVPILNCKKEEIFDCIENVKTKTVSSSEYMTVKYSNGKFCDWLGKLISKVYKGENIKHRALYATDCNRLTYIIGTLISGTKKSEWITDDSGLNVIEVVIKPVLTTIHEMLDNFLKESVIDSKLSMSELEKIYDIRHNAILLMNEIRGEKLNNSILKIIASELHFKRFKPELDKYYNDSINGVKQIEDKKILTNDNLDKLDSESSDSKSSDIKHDLKSHNSHDSDCSSKSSNSYKPKIFKPKILKQKEAYESSSDEEPKKKPVNKKVYESSDDSSSSDEEPKKKIVNKKEDVESKKKPVNKKENVEVNVESKKKPVNKKVYESSDDSSSSDEEPKKKIVNKKENVESKKKPVNKKENVEVNVESKKKSINKKVYESSDDSSSDEEPKKKLINKKENVESKKKPVNEKKNVESKKKPINKKVYDSSSDDSSSDEESKKKEDVITKKNLINKKKPINKKVYNSSSEEDEKPKKKPVNNEKKL
jgi:hypothetical protein